MPRKAIPQIERSKLLKNAVEVKEVDLRLPPAHPTQVQLTNAFDSRRNPTTGEIYYDDDLIAKHSDFPLAFPGLRFIVGACGTKFASAPLGL